MDGLFFWHELEMNNTSFTVPHNYVEFIERLWSKSPSFYMDDMDEDELYEHFGFHEESPC
jgi:hypothetical protein